MPADYIIDPDHNVVFSRGTGVFTREDYINHMRALICDPMFKSSYNQIVDCRSISAIALTSEEIREVAMKSVFGRGSRRAFVVASDLHYGLSRMLASYSDLSAGHAIEVFRTMELALAWLQLPVDLDPFSAKQ